MTQILEDLENHPKEVKRVLDITDKQFKKIIENAQNLEENKKKCDSFSERESYAHETRIPQTEKRLIQAFRGRKKLLKASE